MPTFLKVSIANYHKHKQNKALEFIFLNKAVKFYLILTAMRHRLYRPKRRRFFAYSLPAQSLCEAPFKRNTL